MSVKERVWLGCGDESHVCGAAAALLEAARADVAALPAAPRRRALARCKDLHEAALSALQVLLHLHFFCNNIRDRYRSCVAYP